MFSSKSRFTWINVEPLSHSAISSLISKTLRRSEDECEALSTFITRASSGNAFSVKNILTTLQRQHHVGAKSVTKRFQTEETHFDLDYVQLGKKSLGVSQTLASMFFFLMDTDMT